MNTSRLIKTIRTEKRLTTENVASEIGISNALYKSKEDGHLSFLEFEISKLSALFELELPLKSFLNNEDAFINLQSENVLAE